MTAARARASGPEIGDTQMFDATRMLPLRLAAALLVGSMAATAIAAGKPVLLMHPTLVVFDGATRSATVNLVNRGDAAGVFVVSWIDYAMTPDGGLLAEETPGPWSAQSHVRFSPRRVTLEPGQTQVIRLGLRRSPDAKEGEYRSHLKVLALPVQDSGAGADAAAARPTSSVSVVARPAMSIPVIWRNGPATSGATIESATFDASASSVRVSVLRSGALSVRGYLHLLGPADRAGSPLVEPMPLVIYSNLPGRTISLPLAAGAAGHGIEAGTEVVYSSSLDPSIRRDVLASFRMGP